MRIYNVIGYAIFALQLFLSAFLAPEWLGPWGGMAVGMAYLLLNWVVGGVYISDILHMGIAHRALEYKQWFLKTVVLVNNTAGVYVDPVSWVNRHRLHHRYSDHAGDPNKLAGDGFWKTLYLSFSPYPSNANLSNDDILKTWQFRLVAHPVFAMLSPLMSCGLLWLVVRDWPFAIGLWAGVRVFGLWVNMIQNYWAHDRRYGTRRYDDADNSVNILDWLPVLATFSACIQNNHHHYANMYRLSHAPDEFDFGYKTVRLMNAMGLVKPTKTGLYKPSDVTLIDLVP